MRLRWATLRSPSRLCAGSVEASVDYAQFALVVIKSTTAHNIVTQ